MAWQPSSMETRRPQLDLDDLRQLGWLLGGLLSVLAIWTILYVELDKWTLLIPATSAVVAAIVWPRLPALIPSALHTLAFPIIVAQAVLLLVSSNRKKSGNVCRRAASCAPDAFAWWS